MSPDPTATLGRAGIVYDAMPIPLDPGCTSYIDAGPLRFGVEMRAISDASLDEALADDPHAAAVFGADRPAVVEDGGVSIHVIEVDGDVERLRFDCFASDPHYHYLFPEHGTQRYLHYDAVACGDILPWALDTIERRLPQMLRAVSRPELAAAVSVLDLRSALSELRAATVLANRTRTSI